MTHVSRWISCGLMLLPLACASGREIGYVERLSPELDKHLAPDVVATVVADGFSWSEGPVWSPRDQCLLFSDVPNNVVHKWTEQAGCVDFLRPSGYTGTADESREPGSNGLAIDRADNLLLCQHGDRRVARLVADLDDPRAEFHTIADRYDGRRFNSPNDLVLHSSGAIYFTDPPYGLRGGANSPDRELPFHGVFRIDPDGAVTLLTDELSRPNGIALSPDERTLYVANSDPKRSLWMAYDLSADGTISEGRTLFDATTLAASRKGNPDGMKVATSGVIFATGPGGVLVLSPEGQHLGTLRLDRPAANCAFGEAGSTLFITADDLLLRVPVTATGLGF